MWEPRRPVTGIDLLFFYHSLQAGCGVYPASYPWVPGSVSPGVKWPGREVDHLPPFNAEVKNGGAIHPLPHTSSWHRHRHNFTFLLNSYGDP
jgi:hypothetical protein